LFLRFFATKGAKGLKKRLFEVERCESGLSERADEVLIHVDEVEKGKGCEAYFKSQNTCVLLNCHEVSVLKYVGEDENFKEQGAAYAA
jgi:hypothetical protein